ncbi:MAG: NAD(P)-dependent oxidoreductase, partial [Candidatus Thorarchaeota archaeon]
MSDDSQQSKAVLITGGTGFIGSHLARRLVQQGNEVVLLDLYPNEQSVMDII